MPTADGPSAQDDVYVLSTASGQVDGGDGVDTLAFGPFRARFAGLWNRLGESGGVYDLTDPATGATSSVPFKNIEILVGSAGADDLRGNGQILSIYGGEGDDRLAGQGLDDPHGYHLFGGDGADLITGGELGDEVNGNKGADTLRGFEGSDTLYGGQGEDSIGGGDGDDLLNGNLGGDSLDGGAGADTVYGGQGDDMVSGGVGDDHLYGSLGSDTLTGGGGGDVFHVGLKPFTDVITDFNYAEGDRIQVDGDVDFRAQQVGDDVQVMLTYGTQGTPVSSDVLVLHANLTAYRKGWISHAAEVWR